VKAAGFVLFSVSLALVATTARAQPADDADATARARTLFTDGVALAQSGSYGEAEAHFRQALALHDAPTIRYNLASVLFEQHEYAEAHELAAALLADGTIPDSVRQPTTALETQIEAASALVSFEVPTGVLGEVQLDDAPIAEPAQATAVAPGHHVARVVADGTTTAQVEFDATAGEHATIALVAAAAEPASSASPAESGDLTQQWWFWTAIGGGVVVVAVAIGVGVAVANNDAMTPVSGNFMPGVIRW
jgi:tetratricopeptide (TPR) repeat protein